MKQTNTPLGLLVILALLAGPAACIGGPGANEPEPLDEQSDYHVQLAHGNWQAGEVPQAIQELEIALAIDPENAEAHYLLGFIYSGRQMFPQSIQHYRQAVLLRPDWYEVKNNMGVVFLQMERWEEAEEIFQELSSIPSYGTPGHAYNNLGWAQLNQGHTQEALDSFEMATYLQPDMCLAYNNQGVAMVDLGDERGAEDAFEEAIQRCDEYAEPRFRLARLRQAEGRYVEARQLFEECADLAGRANIGRRCQEYLD